jgi:hypothetical protein
LNTPLSLEISASTVAQIVVLLAFSVNNTAFLTDSTSGMDLLMESLKAFTGNVGIDLR